MGSWEGKVLLGFILLLLNTGVGPTQLYVAAAASATSSSSPKKDVQQGVSADAQALLAFKQAITRDPFHALIGWSILNGSSCQWQGVTCLPQYGRATSFQVSSISLPDLALQATTSSALAALASLQALAYLDISGNRFAGSIPASLANCSNLRVLNLSSNYLHGPIPNTVGRLVKLEALWLQNNYLSGSIPESLANCSDLRELILFSNQLRHLIQRPNLGGMGY